MQVRYFAHFIEELSSLDKSVRLRIEKKLRDLAQLPFEQFEPLALKGAQFKGLYKLRIGDWRLIYKIANREIHFITLGHRSEVYRG